jgi:FixJ family two-component response regulator
MSATPARPLVVVVEDNPSMRAALGRLLRASGFETALHASAEDFLIHPPTTSPACFVVDVQLPGVSGLDLQARLVADKSNAVIIVTGHDDAASRHRANSLGCVGYFSKPFAGQHLVELIKRHIAKGSTDARTRSS